jgi:hypothetical protein
MHQPIRREWLFQVVGQAQLLAVRLIDGPLSPHESQQLLAALPPPQTRLEQWIVAGLLVELSAKAGARGLGASADARLAGIDVRRSSPHEARARSARQLLETEYAKPWTIGMLARSTGCNGQSCRRRSSALQV